MFPFPSAAMLAAHTLVPWLPVAAVKSKAYRPFKLAFEDVPVIMTDALALLALSVMELANDDNLSPRSAAVGAVYVVLAPLAVETGLKEPQVELGVATPVHARVGCGHWILGGHTCCPPGRN